MLDLKILGLDHIVLRTERLDEVLSFYRDKLGLPLERELRAQPGMLSECPRLSASSSSTPAR